jgi:hypothetical protein
MFRSRAKEYERRAEGRRGIGKKGRKDSQQTHLKTKDMHLYV